MTGKWDIAVATSDNNVYYKLVNELKKRKINFIVRHPQEEIPLSIKAVITTKEEIKFIKHHTILAYEGVDETINNALKLFINIPETSQNKMTIGIDPGKCIGVAILNNDSLMQTARCNTLQEVFQLLRRTISSLKPKEMIIKIGNKASPIFLKEISERTSNLSNDFNLKTKMLSIDEKYTTANAKRLKVKRLVKDEASAIKIALR